ncbi:hypothetical protein [Aliarcobacter butzleri]|uniref:hypothetical protein n=1 Tax=Aliarcobacter butzleri TaxID=28197 RepID=UPI00263CE269|nr:hypothetical protein [Aliarcobacter butzleri]MDN5060466.1 hypothetical protein [Aliarcobacter butzleri]
MTLLYVEDDDNAREELEYFLEKKVLKLIVAKNGQEGLELFKKYIQLSNKTIKFICFK